ncbi:MAG: stage 0 sporulation family protein [Dehalococcoidales bacterium]|nr:stage 0 sporulation family protein [Dehalococcoidales bacterium]
MRMADVVGIRFKRTGKMYYFDPAGIDLNVSDYVVVKTARGLEMGQVVVAPRQVLDSEVKEPLKPVVRKAEPEDIKHAEELEQKTAEALAECGKLIEKLELPMKLLAAEYGLTGNRLTFFFSASERVDFRELVKELTSRLKVRVELRQVGPRDGAKLIGGYGRCGRQLCCSSFLTEFEPVSIRMAKDQDLPLNPMKISGTCGRLMCCLGYEGELYRAMREKLPKKGQRVMTNSGAAVVTGNNPLKQTVLVELKSGAIVELPADEVTIEAEQPHKPQKKKG